MQKQHDFIFGINIPVNIPDSQEIELIEGSLEEHINALIQTGHMTIEEAVAYVKFSAQLAAFVPFMLDGFLQSYRSNIQQLNQQKESKIIT
jgi:DNA-binding NtrC family response regulator